MDLAGGRNAMKIYISEFVQNGFLSLITKQLAFIHPQIFGAKGNSLPASSKSPARTSVLKMYAY